MIDGIPGGLDCELLPSGAPLSPGQVRRLVLARALVARPGLLLIDDTLDFLSNDDEVQDQLVELFVGGEAPWTAVITTRDPRVRARLSESLSITEQPR